MAANGSLAVETLRGLAAHENYTLQRTWITWWLPQNTFNGPHPLFCFCGRFLQVFARWSQPFEGLYCRLATLLVLRKFFQHDPHLMDPTKARGHQVYLAIISHCPNFADWSKWERNKPGTAASDGWTASCNPGEHPICQQRTLTVADVSVGNTSPQHLCDTSVKQAMSCRASVKRASGRCCTASIHHRLTKMQTILETGTGIANLKMEFFW